MRASLTLTSLLALAIGASLAPLAHAADTPSSAQIIDALTPGDAGNMTTRGIRLGGQPPAVANPGTPASTAPAKAAPVATQGQASLNVPFASGSSAISPAATRVLNQLGEALTNPKLAGFKFRIEGHTDTVGSADRNKTLSEQRAASVTEYLVTKYGIDRARLTPAGMGEDGLLVSTGTGVSNAANRRVLVVNMGS